MGLYIECREERMAVSIDLMISLYAIESFNKHFSLTHGGISRQLLGKIFT